ncbi:MAG: acylphosphatase [Arenibacterium sp.]
MTEVLLHIRGDLGSDQAIPWICHRARLLDLKGWVQREGSGLITVALAGPAPLVDAMEVACSLGPADVLVERIDRAEHRFKAHPNGFSVA